MRVRKFNEKGNNLFKSKIQNIVQSINKNGFAYGFSDKNYEELREVVFSDKLTDTLEGSKELSKNSFVTRFDFGKNLYEVLKSCEYNKIICDEYLWNWLSGFYIKNILSDKAGLKISRFLYTNHFHDLKLHLIRTAWLLYSVNKSNSEFALCSPLYRHTNMCEQYISRPELFRNPKVAELCMDLYFDQKNREIKKNSDNHRKNKEGKIHPGVLYPRLYKYILKLSKIYDLWSADIEEFRKIIGKEFKIWHQENIEKKDTKIKSPNWTRNERIILLKYYFEEEDPMVFSKNKEKISIISKILKNLDEHDKDIKNIENFRSEEGVRRKILNFCEIDPRIPEEENTLENYSKDDEKIFTEFFDNKEKIEQLKLMFNILIKKNEKK
jgi:hypothetical protein